MRPSVRGGTLGCPPARGAFLGVSDACGCAGPAQKEPQEESRQEGRRSAQAKEVGLDSRCCAGRGRQGGTKEESSREAQGMTRPASRLPSAPHVHCRRSPLWSTTTMARAVVAAAVMATRKAARAARSQRRRRSGRRPLVRSRAPAPVRRLGDFQRLAAAAAKATGAAGAASKAKKPKVATVSDAEGRAGVWLRRDCQARV